MRAAALLLVLGLAGCERAPEVVFKDASVTLPDDPIDLPDAPGRDAVMANCTACHSPSTMLQQPRVSAAKWEAIVAKMRKLYKAPVSEADVPAIVGYMVAVQGQQSDSTP